MTQPEPAYRDVRRRRLLYRATHRGTYENDILFGGFVQRHIDACDELDLAALEALLDTPDNELADWLTGRLPIPPGADAPMLHRIREECLSHAAGEGREGVRPTRAAPPPQVSPATRERENGA